MRTEKQELDTCTSVGAIKAANPSSYQQDESLPLGQAIKRYPKIVGYCLALTVSIIGWGYDLVIVGSITSVTEFQRDYGEWFEDKWIIPSMWLSFWLAFGPLGNAVGSLVGGWIQDRIGRKYSLMIGSVISGIAVAIIFVSNLPADIDSKRGVFLAGKVVQGFSVGIIKITAMTYVSETCPTSLRGPAMALFPTFTLIGQLVGSVVVFAVEGAGSDVGYRAAFASQWILSIAPFILSVVMPDSPAHLVRSGKVDQAERAAQRLFAPRVDAADELRKLHAAVEYEANLSSKATYKACFTSTHRRRTNIVMLANLLPAMFGLNLLSNSSYFVQTIGMNSSQSLMFLIAGVVGGIFANGCSIWLLSRVGRRSVTIVSIGITGLLWTGMGIAGFWSGKVVAYLSASIMIAVILVCGMGCWPAGYAVMGETSSLQLRAKTQAIGGVAQQVSSIIIGFVLPYIFNPDMGDLGAKTGFVFAGLSAAALVACWFCLPEMKGRDIMEIDHMFEMRLPTRDFGKWTADEHHS